MSAKYFHEGERFHILAKPLSTVVSVLNAGLSGCGTVTIKAGQHGLSIAIAGKVVAKGRTPTQLHAAFNAAMDAAMKASQPAQTGN